MERFPQDFCIITQIKGIHIRKEDGPLLNSIIIPSIETSNLSTDSILWRQWWIELCPIRSMANLRKGTQSPISCRCNKRLHFISAFTVQFHVIVDILLSRWNYGSQRGHWLHQFLELSKGKVLFRGHSTTMWTEFCHFLTPPPPAWTVFIPWARTKTDIFWPPPPSSCPRTYWMYP